MEFDTARKEMVEKQLSARDIRDFVVLDAFRRIPRHEFVPPGVADFSYSDRPLSIGYGQTISQPYMVARMTEALELSAGLKVLEVGTGSGYQTAILCDLDAVVFTIERIPELAERARSRLLCMGYKFYMRMGDGTLGWPEEAPFDRILVAAGAPAVPLSLGRQLRSGGIMVLPVGDETQQELLLVRRQGEFFQETRICSCHFVKLVGEEGW